MTDAAYRIGAIFVWAFLLFQPTPALSSLAKKTRAEILCLHRGASRPMPCTAVKPGSIITVNTAGIGNGRPLIVAFTGRKDHVTPRVVLGTQPQAVDGSYMLTVPRRLCSGERMGNFEIQLLMSDLQNPQELAKIASLPVRC